MNDWNERITELEIRITRQDHTVEELNDVIYAQQRQIDLLTKKIAALEKSEDPTTPVNEKPPHY